MVYLNIFGFFNFNIVGLEYLCSSRNLILLNRPEKQYTIECEATDLPDFIIGLFYILIS